MKGHLVLFAALVLLCLNHLAEAAPASTGHLKHGGHHPHKDVPFYPEGHNEYVRSREGIDKRTEDCARCCNDYKCRWFMQGPCGCR